MFPIKATEAVADKDRAGAGTTSTGTGKAQVWVRVRPLARFEESFMGIGEDGKTLRMLVNTDDRITPKRAGSRSPDAKCNFVMFTADGILQNSSQEETYAVLAKDVVCNAMNGVSGVVVCLGPESCGKSFTLFGKSGKFPYRGVICRALEEIFEIMTDRAKEMNYFVRIAMVEIRKNRICDLLMIGQNGCQAGPTAFHYEPVDAVETGLVYLMMGLAAQKNTPREPYSKHHTVVYLDIFGQSLLEEDRGGFQSRITFAKIASIPKRSSELDPQPQPFNMDDMCPSPTCPLIRKGSMLSPRKAASSSTCHCSLNSARGPPSPVSEAIEIRKDLFLLEQMFERANEAQKLQAISPRKSKASTSQYFRQCKLALCLQDIVATNTEVRIILNIRPEKQYLQRTLEAMRFARKAEAISHDVSVRMPGDMLMSMPQSNPETLQQELSLLHEELDALQAEEEKAEQASGAAEREQQKRKRTEMSDLYTKHIAEHASQLNPTRSILLQSAAFLDGKIADMEIGGKRQVKVMLEAIRQMWQYKFKDESGRKGQKSTYAEQSTQIPDEQLAGHFGTMVCRFSEEPVDAHAHGTAKRKKSHPSVSPLPSSVKAGSVDSGAKLEHKVKVKAARRKSKKGIAGIRDREIEGHIGDGAVKARPSVSVTANSTEGVGVDAVLAIVEPDSGARASIDGKVASAVTAPASAERPISHPTAGTTHDHDNGNGELVRRSHSLESGLTELKPSEAWDKFMQTPSGEMVIEQFNRQRSAQQECAEEMTSLLIPIGNILINSLHKFAGFVLPDAQLFPDHDQTAVGMNLNPNIWQSTNMNTNTDVAVEKKSVITELKFLDSNCDEFILKMVQVCDSSLKIYETIVDKSKVACEEAFIKFTKETPGLSIEGLDETLANMPTSYQTHHDHSHEEGAADPDNQGHGHPSLTLTTYFNHDRKQREHALARNYEEISRHAKKQARQLIKYHSRRPSWVSSFSTIHC